MEWEVIYEISRNPLPDSIIGGCFVGVCIICSFIIHFNEKKMRVLLFHGVCLLLVVSLIFLSISEEKTLSKNYYSGNYKVYEGELKNYEKVKSTIVHFEIGEDLFAWTGRAGLIPEEGYVRVFVCDDDIVRIDKHVEKTKND